jgi:GxxExxY protein
MVVNRQGTKTAKENDTTNTQSTNTEMKLLVPTDLPPDLEHLVQETIGSCIAVHRELGPGLLESIYPRAVAVELQARGISFELERSIPVRYRGQVLCHQRLDVLIDSRLILEIKSVERILAIQVAQVISYLRVTGTRVALLVNFNVPILAQGIRRVVL